MYLFKHPIKNKTGGTRISKKLNFLLLFYKNVLKFGKMSGARDFGSGWPKNYKTRL